MGYEGPDMMWWAADSVTRTASCTSSDEPSESDYAPTLKA